MSKLTIAAGAATVAVASLAYLLLKQRKVGKELFSMLITEDEDGMNKAAGLDAGPFRTLPLEDVEGLRAALASGEIIKVDCKAFAKKQQAAGLKMESLIDCPVACRSHTISRPHPFAPPIKESFDMPFGEILSYQSKVCRSPDLRPTWWGLFGAEAQFGALGACGASLRRALVRHLRRLSTWSHATSQRGSAPSSCTCASPS